MTDKFTPDKQRGALLAFARALNSSPRALRRDECGDWRIGGNRGHAYAVPGGFQFYCAPGSTRAWTFAKRAMSFAKVTQDGDEEGILFLDRLPTEAEAGIMRRYVAIPKRREMGEPSEAQLAARAAFADRSRPGTGPSAELLASPPSPVHPGP
jgi:hypothetical protein